MQPRSQPKHICRAAGLIVVAAVLLLAVTARADDDDIVNANGFELPFSTVAHGTGQLEGQVNPAGEGQILPPGQWLRAGSMASTARVQSAVFAPGGGVQAVRVDRAADNDLRWAVPVNHLGYPDYPTPFPPEPAQPFIAITWDMRVEQSTGSGDGIGLFFGVEAYDDAVNPLALLGALGVDATTGAVVYQAPGTGVLTPTGGMVSFGEWNRFQIQLDYSTHQFTIFHNLAALGTFAFVDAAAFPGQLNELSDVAISVFGIDPSTRPPAREAFSPPPRPPFGSNPQPPGTAGSAYFDNFLVREGAIPEPASGSALLLIAAAVMQRRSRIS